MGTITQTYLKQLQSVKTWNLLNCWSVYFIHDKTHYSTKHWHLIIKGNPAFNYQYTSHKSACWGSTSATLWCSNTTWEEYKLITMSYSTSLQSAKSARFHIHRITPKSRDSRDGKYGNMLWQIKLYTFLCTSYLSCQYKTHLDKLSCQQLLPVNSNKRHTNV